MAGIYAALLRFVLGTLPALPPRTAIHFNLAGRANGWATPDVNAAFMLAGPLALLALFGLIWWLTWRFPSVFPLNVPQRDHWLRPGYREEALLIMGGSLLWFCAILTLFMGAIHWVVLEANRTQPAYSPPGLMLPVVIGLCVIIAVWLTVFMRQYARTRPPSPPPATYRRRALVAGGMALLLVLVADLVLVPWWLRMPRQAPVKTTPAAAAGER